MSQSHPIMHFVYHTSEALNNKKHSIAIFCDLKKAFDSCDHKILINKLSKYGVAGTELHWFKSYLNYRQQFVEINGVPSTLQTIILGVPQGSILGPLLFLIYINDLPNASNFLSLLFADDTTLLLSHHNLQQLIDTANIEFQKICEYFRINKLALHQGKTNYILITNTKVHVPIHIYCNNNNDENHNPRLITEISQITNDSDIPAAKFLGVFLDPQLNFRYHIDSVRKRLSQALYSLRLAKNLLNTSSLILLYHSLFHCHLIYALPIWSCTSSSILSQVFTMQKNAIRTINNVKYNAHTDPCSNLMRFFHSLT